MPDHATTTPTAQEAAALAVGRARRAQQRHHTNRAALLWAHVFITGAASPLILVFGLAYKVETEVGVWTKPLIGVLGIIGSGLLAYGLMRRSSDLLAAYKWERIGLGLLALWDLALAGAFAWVVAEVPPQAGLPWEVTPETSSRPYPTPIYLGLMAMLVLHVLAATGALRAERLDR